MLHFARGGDPKSLFGGLMCLLFTHFCTTLKALWQAGS
jgi:hypothetical protein